MAAARVYRLPEDPLSENTKGKSGSRDISELKARLGLKKGDSAGGRAR